MRELEHWVESAVVLSPDGRIAEELLPQSARTPNVADSGSETMGPGLTLQEATRRYIRATVEACGGNKTEAAKRLGVGRNTVARALKD